MIIVIQQVMASPAVEARPHHPAAYAHTATK